MYPSLHSFLGKIIGLALYLCINIPVGGGKSGRTPCTVFEINDGATLDDGKMKVLTSGSHEYVDVTCAVSFEFKSADEILSLCSTCIVRFSGAVGKVLSL